MGAQRSRGRLAPPGRRGVQSGAARSPPRPREERGAPGSGARKCPAAAKTAPQMGRSCALTGLNWKRSEPAILKAGGVGGGCGFPLCPPRPARDPGRPSAAVRPAAGRRPRARPHAASPRGARVSPPSVWPALRSVDSFTSRSHWPSVCPSLLSRAVPPSFRCIRSHSRRPSPPLVTRFLRSPLAFLFLFFSFALFVLHLLASLLPGSPPAGTPRSRSLSSAALFDFPFPVFGRRVHALVFFPRISLRTPSRSPDSPRRWSCPSAPRSALSAGRAGAPRRPRGVRRAQQERGPPGWVPPDAARPARPRTCPRRCCRRCATAASGWDQRSQANCFSLSPNCGFYQESLFQRAQTRSSAASLVSSADPRTPPALPRAFPPPAGRRPELPGHSVEAREAPAGWADRGGSGSGPRLRDVAARMRRARAPRPLPVRARAGGAAGLRTRLPSPGRSGAISGDGAVQRALAHGPPAQAS